MAMRSGLVGYEFQYVPKAVDKAGLWAMLLALT